MTTSKTPKIGTLMARVDAPEALYCVTSLHGNPQREGFIRVLPYQRSGSEFCLLSMRVAGRKRWVADGSEWVVVDAR